MITIALVALAAMLVLGGLIYYAIRKGREVDAVVAHGRTVFKLKVK